MKRLLQNKNRSQYFFMSILSAAVLAISVSAPVAAATNPPGCYSNSAGKKTTCPPGVVDNNGKALNPGKNCYVQGLPPGNGQPAPWINVKCADLTTPISSTAGSGHVCGGGNGEPSINTGINLGCTGSGNPIMDLTFAIVRLLAAGVGIVVIASVIFAGIQYSTSRGDPQAAAGAMKRLSSAVIALFVFIFAYAILNFVIPGGFFHG